MTPATFLPIIVMAIIFGSMGNTIGGIEGELQQKPVIALIDADNGNYSDLAVNIFNYSSVIVYRSDNLSEIEKEKAFDKLEEKNGVALIVIKENFTENISNTKKEASGL